MIGIEEHKWYDDDVQAVVVQDDDTIIIESMTQDSVLNKSDAIAIAKHFGLLDNDFLNKCTPEAIKILNSSTVPIG